MLKRGFDVLLSGLGLVLFSPLIVVLILFASIDTRSNGVFIQKRIGKDGRVFILYKLRTMKGISEKISKIGFLLRKYKMDEILQLFNVFIGDMSFVGPRPDIPGYADKLEGEDRLILNLKPGITGPASLKYYNEEELLSQAEDPLKYNDEVIYPDKVKINLEYYYNRSFWGDIIIIINTIFRTNY